MEKQVSNKPLSNTELSSFCNQMALILQSGMSTIEGVSLMLEEAASPAEKALLQTIYDRLLETGSLYQALEAAEAFPPYLLHMTEIGEQTGRLDEVMPSLSLHYEREENISQSVKSAVTYPLIMITMMVAVILILITRVMPIFNQVFAQLGQEMTGFAGGLLALGSAINTYSMVLVGLLILALALFFYFTKTEHGKKQFVRLGCHFSFFRDIYEKTASCRFASAMALTLSSGLNPEYSLELSEKLIDNALFQKKLTHCRTLISEGAEFSAALTEAGIFSGIYGRMTALASRTGGLDTVMREISEKYEEELDARLNGLISVLEPSLVILLSVIVGIILLSVMLPLMGIMSSL